MDRFVFRFMPYSVIYGIMMDIVCLVFLAIGLASQYIFVVPSSAVHSVKMIVCFAAAVEGCAALVADIDLHLILAEGIAVCIFLIPRFLYKHTFIIAFLDQYLFIISRDGLISCFIMA